MKNPVSSGSLAGILWVGATLLIGGTVWGHLQPVPVPAPIPEAGDRLALPEVDSAFGLSPADGKVRWFVVLGTACPASEALARDLSQARAAAEDDGASLVPLVIVDGIEPGSLLNTLRSQGFATPGVADINGASALRIGSVPILLKVDGAGEILDVAGPSIPGSWPVEPD